VILLDRYLFKQFSRNILYVLAALVTIYLLIDFFERIDNFVGAQQHFSLAAKYFLLKTPLIIEQLFPVIILLGGIIVLGILNHHGEILALKAVGIKTFRITVPITVTALAFSLLTLAFAEWVVPPATAHSNKILHEEVRQEKPRGIVKENRFYYKDQSGFYSFEEDGQKNNSFQNFIFTNWDTNYSLEMYLTAESAFWQNGEWTFSNCRIKQKNHEGAYDVTIYDKINLQLSAEPGDFFVPEYKIDELSLSGLYSLAKSNKGTRGTEAGLKFLERISFIFLGIPLLMLGLPLLLIAHQKWDRDLSIAIPLSCGLAFAAWGGWSVMQSLAKTAIINPHFAAWSVHLLIGALGTFLILQQDR